MHKILKIENISVKQAGSNQMKSLQVGLRMTGSNFLNMKGDDNIKIMRSTASLKNKTSL